MPGHVQGSEWSRWERGIHRPAQLEQVAKVLDTSEADLVAGPVAERTASSDGDLGDGLSQADSQIAVEHLLQQMKEQLDGLEVGQVAILEAVAQLPGAQESERLRKERGGSTPRSTDS